MLKMRRQRALAARAGGALAVARSPRV